MTEFELATLRLHAFSLLDGWGKTDEKGKFRQNNLDERKQLSDELVDWASRNPANTEGEKT